MMCRSELVRRVGELGLIFAGSCLTAACGLELPTVPLLVPCASTPATDAIDEHRDGGCAVAEPQMPEPKRDRAVAEPEQASESQASAAQDSESQASEPLADALAQGAGEQVDQLAADADPLPAAFWAIIAEFMALESFPHAFAEDDLARVRILPESHPGAQGFLPADHSAITLDALVILKDERYAAIAAWNSSWEDVVVSSLTAEADDALFTMLHELVHVRQFREMGRDRFLSEYLAVALQSGEHDVPLEAEAYAISPGEQSWARMAIAALQSP